MNQSKSQKIKMVYEVSKWEFGRWFKFKEQIVTLLIGACASLFIFGGKGLLEKFSESSVTLVVLNGNTLPFTLSGESPIRLVHKNRSEMEAQKLLMMEKKIDGILTLIDIDHAELLVNREGPWLGELKEALDSARRRVKMEQSGISPEQLAAVFEPVSMNIVYAEAAPNKRSLADKITAAIFIVLTLLGIFTGLSYQFVAITGEKQLRITEVIVSAISPQTWIDGKIIGISLLSLALLVTLTAGTMVFVLISSLFGSGWAFPIVLTSPWLVLVLFLLSIGGFLFWNTFFSAIAATIHDPNTSARNSLIMVPVIPVGIAFYALKDPDSWIMKILSLFPLTSAPVLSARLVLTEVPIIEVCASLSLLILSICYLRKLAGIVFATSILIYGKEPSWKEISRWIRESGQEKRA
jgi:ABC-2 type transport system permease protein